MTREEAIHFATCLKNNWTINFADMEDFCDMAIEALSDHSGEVTEMVKKDLTSDGDLIYRADAVEVVRCKDCRHFKKIVKRSDSGLCHRDLVASVWKENGYCSRGERKGGYTE